MDERQRELDLKEGLPVLPTKRQDMAASEEADWHTALGGGEEGPIDAAIRISRKPLVRTPRNMGHVREANEEVLVVEKLL